MRLSSSALLLAMATTSSFSQGWQDMACLPTEKQQALLNRAKEISEQFQLDEKMKRFRTINAQRSDLADEAYSCKSRLNNPFEMFSAIGDSCHQKIQRYNALVEQENGAESILRTSQEIALRQLTLERAAYPSCR